MISTVKIVFFSGTGCTARSADALKDSLERLNVEVSVRELRGPQKNTPQINADLLVIMYPVYAFDAPLPIYEYVDLLGCSDGQSAAIVPVSGGGDITPNRACRLGIRKRLEQKGFAVVYESMIVMPCNVMVYTPESVAEALLHMLPSKCDEIAQDLIQGITRSSKIPFVDKLFSKIGDLERGYWGRIRFSEKLTVDDTCISCGLCARLCPRENIDIIDGIPCFRNDCVMCLHCIYGCPNNAISTGYGAFLVLKKGFSLESYDCERVHDHDKGEFDDLLKGVLWKGVRQYLTD